MIEFKRKTLSNGLRIIVLEDPFSPIATFNMLYKVGARNEVPERTGFAHLFEHLMFGGSEHIENIDNELQRVGGSCNAFTTNDFTNYYMTLPADNIETAFWLESDRMLCPAFTQEKLDIQKNVVVEEFRQRYINQPYGDYQHLFRDLVYKVHPYRWPTIGLKIEHIQDATLAEVEAFFNQNYLPRRAVLTIVGNVKAEQMFYYAEKWFGEIQRDAPDMEPPAEPDQTEPRFLDFTADVPASRAAIAFRSCERLHPDFHKGDYLTDILAAGASSRLAQHLIKDQHICTDVNAYVMGSLDPGCVVLTGIAADGVEPEKVIEQLWAEADDLAANEPTVQEMTKTRNCQEADYIFGQASAIAMARQLAMYEQYGNADMINTDLQAYSQITADDVSAYARKVFNRNSSSTFIYRAKK